MPQPGKPSFTKSTDSFARPPSANMGAFPVTSYRSTSNTSTASMNSNGSMRVGTRGNGPRLGGGRPPSATDSRNGVEETEPEMGKRKGTPILSFQPLSGIALRKTRTQQNLRSQTPADKGVRSQHSGSTVRSSSSASSSSSEKSGRELNASAVLSTISSLQDAANGQQPRTSSLINAFAELSLTPKQRKTSGPKSTTKHHPSLSPVKEVKSPSKIPKFSCTPSLRHTQSSQALFPTPSPLKHKSSVTGLRTPNTSSVRRGGSKDEIPVFLTKEKLTALPAWDTKGRLEDMEQMYLHLRSQFASAADSKSTLEETLSLYKSQGTAHPNIRLLSTR
jgi:hypothetical protein